MKALGEAVTDLPGMAPSADSIVSMARQPMDVAWRTVRTDPAALLWIARHLIDPATHLQDVPTLSLIEDAGKLLRRRDYPFVDWRQAPQSVVYQTCLHQAIFAEHIAKHVGGVEARSAWIAAFLAPLGWLAAAAVQPERIEFGSSPFDHNAAARRLCRSWQLPDWLALVIGNLGLPVGVAQGLGADRKLFQIVQLSVAVIANGKSNLAIAVGGKLLDLLTSLGLDSGAVDAVLQMLPQNCRREWQPPYDEPLLPDLLELALAGPRGDHGSAAGLEQEINLLHRAVHDYAQDESKRLHQLKMDALAEFAAGAGHEINNPLAVISGQAQYLLKQLAQTEPEHDATPAEQEFHESLCTSLQKIVGQTQRIHRLLHDIIQFARPTPPSVQPIDGLSLLAEAMKQILPLAKQRKVELRYSSNTPPFRLVGDAKQLRTVLVALLQNAVEAAPENGWASLLVEQCDRWATIAVRDNGPGLTPLVQQHMFDPFFCGRSAGRGAGLGLPVAWKLAKQNNGSLSFDDRAAPNALFVLRLPIARPTASPCPEKRNGFHSHNSSSQVA